MMDQHTTHAAVSRVPAWFERKFDFAFPVEQYPNLCIRLRGTPARLEEMLRGVPRNILVRKAGDKLRRAARFNRSVQRKSAARTFFWRAPSGARTRWSTQEHAGHLGDLEPLWAARVEDFLQDGDTLTVADLTNRRTHEANHNAHELSAILADFRAARLRLVDRVVNFPPDFFARKKLHPRLKQPMRLVDHLYFVAEHDDHHLAKIWELIS
jgi:hypothetical protein